LGGYTIIPNLKGGWIQAFPEVVPGFFKPLQNQNPFKISLLALHGLSHHVRKGAFMRSLA